MHKKPWDSEHKGQESGKAHRWLETTGAGSTAGSAGETSLDCLTFTGKCEHQGWGREPLPQH